MQENHDIKLTFFMFFKEQLQNAAFIKPNKLSIRKHLSHNDFHNSFYASNKGFLLILLS
jgi:hypothetical protein